jgi:hypothetical protein
MKQTENSHESASLAQGDLAMTKEGLAFATSSPF